VHSSLLFFLCSRGINNRTPEGRLLGDEYAAQ
jgi:hypothetical protein